MIYSIKFLHISVYICIHIHMHTYIHTYIHTYMYVCIYTHTHDQHDCSLHGATCRTTRVYHSDNIKGLWLILLSPVCAELRWRVLSTWHPLLLLSLIFISIIGERDH